MATTELPWEGVDAIRSDGGLVRLRSITAGDAAGIRALHARASDRSIYPSGRALPADLLVRIASLLDDVPEIAELELIVRPTDPSAVCHVSVRAGVRTTARTALLRQ